MIAQNISLKSYNTLNIDAKTRYFAEICEVSDLLEALAFCRQKGIPFWILGGGSNIVLADDIDGLVLHMALRGIELCDHREDSCLLIASAGEVWDELVEYSLHHQLYGLENLSLIPGSVGAAPIQNIGAYGVEVSDYIEWVEVWDVEDESLYKMSAEDCQFGYRESLFKGKLKGRVVVTRVAFRLRKNFQANLGYEALSRAFATYDLEITPETVRQTVCDIRRSKLPDPAELPNAGSFFKNPVVDSSLLQVLEKEYGEIPLYLVDHPDGGRVKVPAGWLIEKAGWKGRNVGSVGVHEKQALVLVNRGGGSGDELLGLAEDIRQSVQNMFNISLETEPQILP